MILINLSFVKACFVVLVGNGLVDITLSSITSCSALWIFFTPFGRRKSYRPNSPIHTSLCVTSFLQRWFTGDPRPIAFFHRCYFCHVGWKRLTKNFFHLRLPVLPCGFSLLPSVVENLTGRTPRFTHFYASLRSFKSGSLGIPGLWHSSIDITSAMLAGNNSRLQLYHLRLPICSWLWILGTPSGLQNLTPGTPRFTHLCASLRSFKDGSLGIPGLWYSSIVVT